jgi:hypothetical protein
MKIFMEDKELIILAIYINVDGKSRSYAQKKMYELTQIYHKEFNTIPNKYCIKTLWFPTENKETRVECVYPLANIISKEGIIENELLKIYKLLSNYKNDEAKEIVQDLERKLKFKKIIKKINEN